MDDFSLQQELEALAGNALNSTSIAEDGTQEPMSTTMSRWQKLFGLSPDEAIERIGAYRNDITRSRVSDLHWEDVRRDRESLGFDRETYEYDLHLQKKKATLTNSASGTTAQPSNQDPLRYLVELGGRLDTPEKVRDAADLVDSPPTAQGFSVESGRDVTLCCVDAAARTALLRWTGNHGNGWEPTILTDPRSMR